MVPSEKDDGCVDVEREREVEKGKKEKKMTE